MSRRRWIMLAGPPLLAVSAAGPALLGGPGLPTRATSLAPVGPLTVCPSGEAPAPGPNARSAAAPGAWWRTTQSLDADGSLDAWVLQVGAPEAATVELRLPAASTVTGPTGGRIVVASEPAVPGDPSLVRIVDAAAGCATEIRLTDRIARRAVADPAGNGVLAHLLEPGSRRDLGVWRVTADDQVTDLLVEPLPDVLREGVGIERVWTTDLRLDAGGRRLAVQACDPDACVTRILDLASGELAVLDGQSQGPIVGFSGRQLITWGACPGLPCPVLAWNGPAGAARILASAAAGAALSGDGLRLAILRSGPDDGQELVAIDPRSEATRSLGAAGRDHLLLSGAAGSLAGLETAGATVAIGQAGLVPSTRALADDSATSVPPDAEVQP